MKFVARVYQRVAHRGDERGAIMIMAAFGLVIMTISASLSIDIGRISLEKRKDQQVADLAALDAARDRNNSLALARASALRNGYDWQAAGHSVGVEIGSLNSQGAFVPNVGSSAVRATISSTVDYLFQVGSRTVTARAVAAMQDFGSFGIGSNLATITTDQGTLLNKTIGPMLGGSALNVTAVGWQGLLTGSLTLSALQTQLVNAGLDVGTLDKLMTTNITLAQLFNASATVLTNQGQLAQAGVLSSMATAANVTQHIKLGSLFTYNQGDPGTVLSTSINLFPFVTGAAEVANGTNFISVPNAGVTVPGVANTALSLQVIEGPKYCLDCKVGQSIQTAQVRLTVTPTLNFVSPIPGLINPTITGDLPMTVLAGAATGTLESVTCTNPTAERIGVDPQPVNLDSSGLLHLSAKILVAQVPLLDMSTSGTLIINGSHGDLDFSPPSGTQHYGSTFVGLQSLPYSTGTVTVLGSLPVSQTTITNAVVASLGPVQGSVDNAVVTPLFKALGLQVGSADVTALGIKCNVLGLVG